MEQKVRYLSDKNRIRCSIHLIITTTIDTFYAIGLLVFCILTEVSTNDLLGTKTMKDSYDADSVVGGYEFLGDLFVSGLKGIVLLILAFLLLIIAFYFALCVANVIVGWRTVAFLNKTSGMDSEKKKIRGVSILQLITAICILLPCLFILEDQFLFWVLGVIFIQIGVAVLSIINLVVIGKKN